MTCKHPQEDAGHYDITPFRVLDIGGHGGGICRKSELDVGRQSNLKVASIDLLY